MAVVTTVNGSAITERDFSWSPAIERIQFVLPVTLDAMVEQ